MNDLTPLQHDHVRWAIAGGIAGLLATAVFTALAVYLLKSKISDEIKEGVKAGAILLGLMLYPILTILLIAPAFQAYVAPHVYIHQIQADTKPQIERSTK